MTDSLFSSMQISASGMAAQRARMDVVAENIANAESTHTASGGPYRRRMVVFQAEPEKRTFGELFSKQSDAPMGVEVADVVQDRAPFRQVFDPSHPDADSRGIVKYPNVNPVQEMVDLTSAGRSFESNVTVMEASKRMFLKTLDLLR